jgi:TolB-like protein/Flp pilus assembly protein TadD
MSFLGELKRRSVFRVGAAYAIVAWLVIQMTDTILPTFDAPRWVAQSVTFLLILGFPVSLILAWAYEVTPQGVRLASKVEDAEAVYPTAGPHINYFVTGLLALAVIFLAVDDYVLSKAGFDESGTATNAAAKSEAGSEPARQSVAVLPFLNMSSDSEQDYFADGIAEEILNILANIPGLRVPSRTSSFSFKGGQSDVREIGNALEVDYVLEGSVRKADDQLRITAQLIEVSTDSHLWSQTYERPLRNVFAIQDEISASVTESLQLELLGDQRTLGDGFRTDSLEAHDAYLKGRHHIARRTAEDAVLARNSFELATQLDPEYAAAYGSLAIAYFGLYYNGVLEQEEATRLALSAIDHALWLDPDVAEAYAARGLFFANSGEVTGAELAFDRAIQISPNYADAWNWKAGWVLQTRLDEALALREQARRLDPLSPQINVSVADALSWQGRTELAREYLNRALQIQPNFSNAYRRLAALEEATGNLAESVRWSRAIAAANPGSPYPFAIVGSLYAELGDLDRARTWYERATELAGSEPLATLFGRYVELVINHDDDAALARLVANLSTEEFSRGGLSAVRDLGGNLRAIRALYEQTWPELIAVQQRSVTFTNPSSALDVIWLFKQEGDTLRAQALIDRLTRILDQLPPDGLLGVTPGYPRDAARARLLALEGRDNEALEALLATESAGLWPYLSPNNVDPFLSSLNDYAEFRALIERIRARLDRERARVIEMEQAGMLEPMPAAVIRPDYRP